MKRAVKKVNKINNSKKKVKKVISGGLILPEVLHVFCGLLLSCSASQANLLHSRVRQTDKSIHARFGIFLNIRILSVRKMYNWSVLLQREYKKVKTLVNA